MDNSLLELEAQLENFVPRGLSDQGRERCEQLIDRLAAGDAVDVTEKIVPLSSGMPWKGAAAAAAVMLGVGMGSGWYLGQKSPSQDNLSKSTDPVQSLIVDQAGFRQLVNGEKEVDAKDSLGNKVILRISEDDPR